MREKNKKNLYKKIALGVLFALFAYFFACGYIPPMLRKKFTLQPLSSRRGDETCAERAAVIDDNESALLYRLRLIESARSEILLSTYSYYNDESGRDITCALFAAAERGVKIRIVADGFNEGKLNGFSEFKALAGHENAEVTIYNPVNLAAFQRANFRLHDKYLVCDDETYLLGGRNIGDYFLGAYCAENKRNLDRDVLVSCPAAESSGKNGAGGDKIRSVSEVKAYFKRVQSEKHNAAFGGVSGGKRYEKSAAKMRARYAALKEKYPDISRAIDAETEMSATKGISLLHGETQAGAKQPLLWKSILNEAKGTGETVIQTPYAICDKAMYSDIAELAQSGTAVTIATNSVRSGANPWGCADFPVSKTKLLKAGAAVLEISAERSSHVKTVLAGENMSYIGSFNLDMRSVYLNTETVLAIDSEEINEALKEKVRALAETGTITKTNDEGGYEFYPGEKYEYRRVPLAKSFVYSVLRIVILPIRHLL